MSCSIPFSPVIDIQIWWWTITKMPFSDSDIRALEPKDNRFRVSIGDALHIEVFPNGGKLLANLEECMQKELINNQSVLSSMGKANNCLPGLVADSKYNLRARKTF